MRLLVRAGPDAVTRLARAAAGLARRGHLVHWMGARPDGLPDSVGEAADWRAAARLRLDAVLGEAPAVIELALAGGLGGARVTILSATPDEVQRWGAAERTAWHARYGALLIAPADATSFAADPAGIPLERIGLWPDGEASPRVDVTHLDTEILERACERALARERSAAPRPALFVDRDGTLVREIGYLSEPGALELLPGVADALRAARGAGLPVIVISNQSGVGRGLFTLERVYQAMARLRELLRVADVELDAIYFCPHRPDENCVCRKPKPGLIDRAIADQRIAVRASAMVGDKRIDAETGQNAGAYGLLVRTGYGRDEEAQPPAPGTRAPDAVFDDLPAAVDWLIERTEEAES